MKLTKTYITKDEERAIENAASYVERVAESCMSDDPKIHAELHRTLQGLYKLGRKSREARRSNR